jgi:LysM domain
VRKWTKSACLVLAWSITPLILATTGPQGPGRPAQANTSTATSTQPAPATEPATTRPAPATTPAAALTVTAARYQATASPAATWTVRPGDTLTAIATALALPGGWQALYTLNRHAIGPDPGLIHPGTTLTLPPTAGPARYTIAPGDTLTAIATALALPGGWQALYTLNRHAIGPDPGLIRPGTTLAIPRPAAPAPTPRPAPPRQPPPATPAPSQQPPRPTNPARPATPAPAATAPPGGMPRWLDDILLTAGLLAATAFAAELATALTRRRRTTPPPSPRPPAPAPGNPPCAAASATIIQADHERLIVTYSLQDDTVYVLTPPGEDPRAVLRAARLILPENTYEELAGHLGVPSAWPLE